MMTSYSFIELIKLFVDSGLYDTLLPFLLIFAIMFAILMNTKVLSKEKNINAVIAFVLGIFFVAPHIYGWYPSQYDPVAMIHKAIPGAAGFMMLFLGFLILLGLFGAKTPAFAANFAFPVIGLGVLIFLNWVFDDAGIGLLLVSISLVLFALFRGGSTTTGEQKIAGGISIISFMIILYYFGTTVGWIHGTPEWMKNDEILTFAVLFAIFGAIVGLVTGGSEEEPSPARPVRR